MPPYDELGFVANASAFIFTGSITRAGASTVPTVPTDATTAVVSVEDVIKAPLGLRNFAGREVTVQLRHALSAGHYVFFADPLAVGEGIAVKEIAHLDGRERKEAVEAVKRGYTAQMAPRVAAAFLVALGTVGEVHPLLSPAERRGRVPWALARFATERILKGKGKPSHVTLVGPIHASKLLPRAPALRAGLHAILILQRPPKDAIAHIPDDERQTAAFIADTSDIQPPDRLATLAQIISGSEKE
jgi:hypothetical protein